MKIFIRAPHGVKVRRHNVSYLKNDSEYNDIRFTVNDKTEEGTRFSRLVALVRNERIVWIHPSFSA